MHSFFKAWKQSFIDVLQNRCSQTFRKFHWKTPILKSVFNKVAGLMACNFIKKKRDFANFTGKHLCWSLFSF